MGLLPIPNVNVQWDSAMYHSDGRPRSRPPASTIHGWVMKWRGTFSGNESLRAQGMREMREARAVRQYYKEAGKPLPSSTGGISFLDRRASQRAAARAKSHSPSHTTRREHAARSHSTRSAKPSAARRATAPADRDLTRSTSTRRPIERRATAPPSSKPGASSSRPTVPSRRATGSSSRHGTPTRDRSRSTRR